MRTTSNTGSSSTTKFSVHDYTTSKVGYVKFTIAFNGGTNGIYQFAIGDGANYSDNIAIGTAQIFSGIQWSFGASNAITYRVLNSATYGTTGITNSTTLFSQSTSNSYIVEAYFNNETTSQNYSRSGSSNAIASGTWDLWIDGTLIGNDLARGGLANNVNIDSWAFNHQSSATAPGTVYLDDIEYSNSLPFATAPLAPTMGTITPGNQQLSIAFTAGGDGGSPLTSYKYSTDGGATFLTRQTGTTASPIVITTLSSDGTTPLTNGTSYNVQIRAVNAIGDGTATASTAATPYTTPSAPTINSITAGNTQLSVDFSANATGGSAITNYQYSTDGGNTFLNRQTGTTGSPIVITTLSSNGSTPLTNGVSYDVQIKAVNLAGAGAASSTTSGTPLAPVTPTITANGTLTAVNTTYGSVSSNTSFTLSGATLTAGITVTPPVGFEVSTTFDFSSNVGNNSSPLVVGSAPTVSTTTIYVRLLATANVSGSPYSGDIALSSSGATNVNVATVSSTVAARELTISGLSASAKTYDGNTNVSVSGSPSFSGLQNGDLAAVTGSPTFAFATSSAGSAKAITQTGSYGASFTSGVVGNYTITQPTLTADINTVAITVTASAQSKNFGEVSATTGATSFTITSGTLVGSDNINTVTLAYSGSPAGNLATAIASTYTITPSAASFSVGNSSNYNITYSTGTLTINAIAASAPTGIVITPSNIQLSVAFTAASNGGSTITSYKYSTDGGSTFLTRQTGTTLSPIIITTLSSDGTTPLTNGVTYPIQIRAITGFGDGTATASVNAIPALSNATSRLWSSASGSAWLSAGNWTGGIPSTNEVAQFGVNPTPGLNVGINGGTTSVGAIEVTSSRILNLIIGNSSGSTSNGTLTFNGVTVNSTENIIIRNNSANILTIQNTHSSGSVSNTMGVALGNSTNNIVSIEGNGGVTISSVISGSSRNLTKIGSGSGVLALTGANTYSGVTTVSSGTLQLNRTGGTTIPNTNNVVINGGTLQISSNQTLNDLTLTSGTLIIDAGVTLTINGTIFRTSGVIRGSATSNLIITGNSGTIAFDQTTPGTTNVLRNLTISGSGTTTLGNALNITGGATAGIVTVGSGATLTTNGNLTLKSDASGTASIGNSAGSISGNVTVERFIPAVRKFRFLAHPFNSAQNLNILTDNIDITGNPAGTTDGTAKSLGTGFTATTGSVIVNNPSAFRFSTADANDGSSNDGGWKAFTTADGSGSNNTWGIGQGIRVLIRGSKGQGLDGSVYTPSNVTLDMSGQLNIGNVNVNLITGGTGNTAGFNLIGNPYASPVDLSAVVFGSNVPADINKTVYTRNPQTGAYVTQLLVNATPFNIPAYTAVFIQNTGASTVTLPFTEARKASSSSLTTFKNGLSNTAIFDLKIGGIVYDNLNIVFNEDASALFENKFDAIKLNNDSFNFSAITSNGEYVCTDMRPFINSGKIKLFTNIRSGSTAVEISASSFNLTNGKDLYFVDQLTNKTLKVDEKFAYTFTIDATNSNSFGAERFYLTTSLTTSIRELNNQNFCSLYPNPASENINLALNSSQEGLYNYTIFNQLGQELAKGELLLTNGKSESINIQSYDNGLYFINLSNGKTAQTIKFIK